jgi:hypothetical protein
LKLIISARDRVLTAAISKAEHAKLSRRAPRARAGSFCCRFGISPQADEV